MNANEHEFLHKKMEAGCFGEKPQMPPTEAERSASPSRSFASIDGFSYPVFGICGYSGSGKTTLIEALIPRLRRRGLKVGVIKQDAHGLDLDRKGKDTDRLFKAGADVLIRDQEQIFARLHGPADADLHEVIARAGSHYDLMLVEGHKRTPLPWKIWLCKPDGETPPADVVDLRRVLGWNEDRERVVLDMLDAWLPEIWGASPVHAGVLIGGGSTRMGRPKHLIATDGRTWIEKTVATIRQQVPQVVLLGAGDVPSSLRTLPVLPDVADADGPLRGMRAAMRWAPRAGWLFFACDQPYVSDAAVAWLLAKRRPGTRAVMPLLPGRPAPEPLGAYYDFRMAPWLERVRRPCDLARGTGVTTPQVPDNLVPAWRNLNSPEDLEPNHEPA